MSSLLVNGACACNESNETTAGAGGNWPSGCAKCASGEGHPLAVLTVSYPGGKTRQFSLRPERVAQVRRWLGNYQKLKEAIEAICELNHDLLRPERAASSTRRKQRD